MKALRGGCRGCLPLAAVVALTIPLSAANWPQWRGPQGQGVSDEVSFPLEWSVGSHVLWKTAIPGRGHSTPVIWGARLFVTTAVEGEQMPGHKAPDHFDGKNLFLHPDSMGVDRRNALKVIAIDTASGKSLWEQVAYDGPMYDNRHKRSSYASTTPVTDGDRVYVHFGPEGTYAYDVGGKLLWKTIVGQIKTMGLGVGASPILHRDLLILQCDEDSGDQSFIAALDTRTGREVWRTRRDVQVSWSTPVLVDVPAARGVAAHTELVTNGNEWIVAYDPATGRELWRTRGVKSNAIHTPLVGEGLVIVTAGFPERRVIAIHPGGAPTLPESDRIAWTYDKGTAYVVSPILYKGLIYLLNDRGVITTLDARSGKVVYEGGRVPKPATFTGSPVAFGEHVLLTSEDGDTFFVKAGPTHAVTRTNSVDEPVYASLALANGRIYIRGERNLFAIGN